MSNSRVSQLRDLQSIIEEISRAIMWVNEREEEELMFDWGDKNIDTYIPRKQENYSVSITFTLFFRLHQVEALLCGRKANVCFLLFACAHLKGSDEGLGGEGEGAEQAQN